MGEFSLPLEQTEEHVPSDPSELFFEQFWYRENLAEGAAPDDGARRLLTIGYVDNVSKNFLMLEDVVKNFRVFKKSPVLKKTVLFYRKLI